MASIVVIDGPDKGKIYPIDRECLTIGRGADCEIVLSDQAVSRRHCEVRQQGESWCVVDLKSSNRTFLNDDPVDTMALKDDDLIGVGDSELKLQLAPDEVPAQELNTTILQEFRMGGAPPAQDTDARLMEKLSFLSMFGRQVESARQSDALLAMAAKALLPVLQAHWVVALLRTPRGWTQAAKAGARVKKAFSRTLLDTLMEKRESVLYANVDEDPALEGQESIMASAVQSVVAAPLRCGDTLLGALYCARREGAFAPEDIFLVSVVCHQVALLLDTLLERESLARDRETLLTEIQETHRIIGQSDAIQKVLTFITRAAPEDATVLIRGETGTGKGLVASALHYGSPRAGKPFVEINCAAIPEQLLESELFGHEKGAFTGALSRKKGRFELADGGTVFLDEIGELSAACQAKVLRLIEERRFERVGGVESLEVDVRIVAATNRDLRQAVSDGHFREDLYWRLDVLHVELPPLRDRPDDVVRLADYFLGRLAASRGEILKLSPEASEALKQHHWPGNVRQLKNVIENAVIMAEGPVLKPADFRLITLKGKPAPTTASDQWAPESLVDHEKAHILRVLQWTKGNKKQAAEILGIERCTLYARLKTYGYKVNERKKKT